MGFFPLVIKVTEPSLGSINTFLLHIFYFITREAGHHKSYNRLNLHQQLHKKQSCLWSLQKAKHLPTTTSSHNFPPWTRATQFADVQGRTSIRKGGVFQNTATSVGNTTQEPRQSKNGVFQRGWNAMGMQWSYWAVVAASPSTRHIIFNSKPATTRIIIIPKCNSIIL